MLPKSRRILKKHFPYILTKGKRYNSPRLLLYASPIDPNNFKESSKFSFSVSKKVSPLAVNRNKYRRQGYSIINQHLKQIKPGFFCFFSFKKGSSLLPFSVLEKEIEELLSISGMLV